MALPINLLQLADGLRKTFVPLGLDKGILDSPYLLISLINIKNKKMKSWTHPKSSFPWTKRQNIWSSFIYSFFCARPFVQKLGTSLIYFVFLCRTIQPKYMVLFHLFIYLFIYLFIFVHDHSIENQGPTNLHFLFADGYLIKIHSPLSFILSFVQDHSTKNLGSHWFIIFIRTRPFDQNIWSFFVYSFFCARPFDQKFESSLIQFFQLHTTIRPKCMVFFNLFFLLCTTISPKIRILIDLFLLFAYSNSTKIYDPLSLLFLLCTAIRPKIRVFIDSFLLLYMTIWLKLGVILTL